MLWTFLVIIFTTTRHYCECTSYNDEFHERLIIKPLPSGHVYTHFQFVTQKSLESSLGNECKCLYIVIFVCLN